MRQQGIRQAEVAVEPGEQAELPVQRRTDRIAIQKRSSRSLADSGPPSKAPNHAGSALMAPPELPLMPACLSSKQHIRHSEKNICEQPITQMVAHNI